MFHVPNHLTYRLLRNNDWQIHTSLQKTKHKKTGGQHSIANPKCYKCYRTGLPPDSDVITYRQKMLQNGQEKRLANCVQRRIIQQVETLTRITTLFTIKQNITQHSYSVKTSAHQDSKHNNSCDSTPRCTIHSQGSYNNSTMPMLCRY